MTEPTLRKDRPTWLTKSLARIKKVPKNETRDALLDRMQQKSVKGQVGGSYGKRA